MSSGLYCGGETIFSRTFVTKGSNGEVASKYENVSKVLLESGHPKELLN